MVSNVGESPTSSDLVVNGERRDTRQDASQSKGTVIDTDSPPAYGRGLLVSIGAAAAVFALAIFASGGKEEYTGVPMTQTTGALFWGLAILSFISV